MAIKPFNSIDGFSVGQPNNTIVIDTNANVTANNLTVTATSNLGAVANVIITGGSANGAVAGGVTVISGVITAVAIPPGQGGDGYDIPPEVTFSSSTTPTALANVTAVLTNGVVTSITVNDGGNGYFVSTFANIAPPNPKYLKTDGYGNLSWSEVSTTSSNGGGGNGTPGGTDLDVQFNDGGVFGGNVNFTYDKVSSNLTVVGNIQANTIYNSNVRIVDYGGLMPYYIETTETILIPNNKQGLFTLPITIDGALAVDGILVEI